MDYRKYAIASFIVLSVLLVSFGITLGLTGVREPADVTEDTEILGIPVQEIAALAVIRDDRRFGLIHQPSLIVLEPPLEGEILSQEEMQAYILDLSHISFERKLQNPGTEEDYGLGSPTAQITVITTAGEKVRVILGDRNRLNNGYYLKRENDDSVYAVSDAAASLFFKNPEDFRDRRIFPELDMEDIDLIREITLDFPEQRNASFQIVSAGNLDFVLSQPVKNSVDFEIVLSKLILPLLTLNADRRFEAGELQDPPGMVSARLSLTVENNAYALTLYRTGDGNRYLSVDGVPGYYAVDSGRLPVESLVYTDLLGGSIYHCNISELDSIHISDLETGTIYTMDISGRSTEMNANINGMNIEYGNLMELYSLLVSTDISRRTGPDESKLLQEPPVFEMTFYRKDGRIDTLQYFAAGKGEMLLAVNGEQHFSTYTKTILDIRRSLDAIVNN